MIFIKKIRESSTFVLVSISWMILSYQWLFGDIEASLTEYATACATVFAIWLGREWRSDHYKKKSETDI